MRFREILGLICGLGYMKSVPNKSRLRRCFQKNAGTTDGLSSDEALDRSRASSYTILSQVKSASPSENVPLVVPGPV